MVFSTRARRHRQQTNSLNNSLKSRNTRKSLSFKKKIAYEAGPTQKYKRKSFQNKNSNSPKILTITSSPVKQSKAKEMKMLTRPRPYRCNLQTGKLNNSLRNKKGKNLFKKDTVFQCESAQNIKRKSYIQKNNVNKAYQNLPFTYNQIEGCQTLEVSPSGCNLIRQCHVLLQRISHNSRQLTDMFSYSLNFKNNTQTYKENVHNADPVINCKIKWSDQKGDLNETLEVSPFVCTSVRQCKVFIQKLDFINTQQAGILYNSLDFKESTKSICKNKIAHEVESCQNFERKYSVKKKNLNETLESSSVNCTSKYCPVFVQRVNSSYRQQTDKLNKSLKIKRDRLLLCKKNIFHRATSVQNSEREFCYEKDNLNKTLQALPFTSTSTKQSQEIKLFATSHGQQTKKLKKSQSGRKPLVCKKNIVNEAGSQRRSKRKSIEKETLNETLEVESVRKSKRKSSILKETLEAGSVRRSKRKSSILNKTLKAEFVNRPKSKSFMQKKNLNETLKVITFTSTPIKQCPISVQRWNDGSLTTYNSRSKKQKNCDKTPILESQRVSTSCTLRPRRQTTCNSETRNLESTKGFTRPPKKSKPVNKTEKNYKSFAGTATIDDLALSIIKVQKRKAKSEGYKIPGKNTLKRRRFVFNELNKADDDYEDDIYESQKFDFFKNIQIDSDSDLSVLSVATPKLGVHVTPMIRKNTPVFRDCISPTEYAINRKVAEECQYRFNKRKNASSASEKTPIPEKKKLEFSRVLTGIQQKEKTIKRIIEGETSELENSYFSDCSRLSEKKHQ